MIEMMDFDILICDVPILYPDRQAAMYVVIFKIIGLISM